MLTHIGNILIALVPIFLLLAKKPDTLITVSNRYVVFTFVYRG